jgi:1,2-diacylglycerol 3-alpha-glucosyltransferase
VDYTPYYLKIGGKSRVVRWGAKFFSTATANLCDYIVTPSDKFKRALLEQNVKRPIRTIPNGINLSSFKKTTSPGIFRNKLGLKSDAPILLSVGRADPEKRLDFLIDAFVLLADRIPEAHLVFAGDGSALNKLKEHAASTKVNHRIHFLGMVKRDELPDLLHDGTIFLSACTNEVHPIAALEAIAAGLPIIVVQDEAFEGMLENDLNGYMTQLDVKMYSETIFKLLQDNKKLESFGKHSALLSEKYSIQSQVSMLEKLYREAISEK